MTGRCRILGCHIDALTGEQAVDSMFAAMKEGRRGWASTVNVATLVQMRKQPQLRDFIERSAWVLADGMPLVWASCFVRPRLPTRVAGIDLIDMLCERAAREGIGVYVLGATQGVIERAARYLSGRHPTLRLDYANGYLAADEAPARADAIAKSGARILLVGMGVPLQENFISEQWERLGVGIAMGVGGSFDVLAGRLRRAPKWMQRCGLEWLFRLAQEPRRLFGRYLITNTIFVLLLILALLARFRWR